MKLVEFGDTIKVHYTGKLQSGEIFDSSEGRDALEFVVGGGMLIPGFDKGVIGMELGEKRSLNIPCIDAYGELNPEYIFKVGKENLPEDLIPEIGLGLEMFDPNIGQPFYVTISEFDAETVTLDANHRLAGKDLIFDVEVIGVLKGN